jgi:glycosyltransferase involved in cell wall biosynthesis
VNAHTHSAVNGLSRYWVVIPAYNEAATIRDVASRAIRRIKNVIVVDDGSTDGTAEALVGLPVALLRNPTNCGKAASLWRGFQQALAAGASGVVTLDGDGQHAPEDIPRLLAKAAFYPDHVIIGARRGDQRRAVFWRYVANRVADFWVSWAAGYSIADSQSGFRVYPASLLSRVKIKHGKVRSFVFESEILIEATRSGHRSLAVPIDALRRPGARPSYFRPVLDIARITCMVGWKLLSWGMYPIGLYRSFFGQTSCLSSESHAVEDVAPVRCAQPAPLSCGTRSQVEEHEEALRRRIKCG